MSIAKQLANRIQAINESRKIQESLKLSLEEWKKKVLAEYPNYNFKPCTDEEDSSIKGTMAVKGNDGIQRAVSFYWDEDNYSVNMDLDVVDGELQG